MFSKKSFLEIGMVGEGIDVVDYFIDVLLIDVEVKWL